MKKGLKKCLSIVLAIAMLVSVMSVSFVVNAAGDTVTINGTEYQIGDIIEVKKEITVNDKWLMDGQGKIPYDNTVLKLVKEDDSVMFPVIYSHNLVWNDMGYEIRFNFLDITDGVDYTNGGILYDLKFEVIGGSDEAITIEDELEVISTFPFEGDPASTEYVGSVLPEAVLDENGTIPADKGTEGEVEVAIETPAASDTLTVNGYEAKVGEVINISKKIQVNNNWLMNGQVYVYYDPEYLQLSKTTDAEMFPNITSGLIWNDVQDEETGKSTGEIIITFSAPLTGYDFTSEAMLYNLPFTVIKGSQEAKNVTDTIYEMVSYNFPGDPADQEDPDFTMVSVVDSSTGDIDSAKGTTQLEPVVNDTPVVSEKIIINGEEYSVGDKINYYLQLQSNNWLINGQYEVTFNSDILELVDHGDTSYPVISGSIKVIYNVVDNEDGTSTIYSNFTTLSGVDFSTLGRIFDYYFVVKEDAEPGEYTISTNVIVTSIADEPGKPADQVGAGEYHNIAVDGTIPDDENIDVSDIITEPAYIDVTELEALIEKAEAMDTEGYTADSVQALADAIASAKGVAADPENKAQVENEIAALQAAIDGLKVDTAELEALIKTAEAMDTEGYTADSIAALNAAIEAAKAVVENPTVADVAAQMEALQAAIDGLKVDTAELDALIAEAKELAAKEGYTEESIAALNDAIAAAEAVAANPTVDDVKAQLEALAAAMAAVKPDTTALETAIAAAEEKLADPKYSPTSKKELQAAVDAAEALLAKIETEFVAYEDVAKATDAINTATENLVEGIILGDVNGDGKLNIDDATYIQIKIAKKDAPDFVELAADVNKDGIITIMDATSIQVILASGPSVDIEYIYPDEA